MCKQLEQETDIASWTENGGLFVGTNAERLAEYKRFAETGKYFGIESQLKQSSAWIGGIKLIKANYAKLCQTCFLLPELAWPCRGKPCSVAIRSEESAPAAQSGWHLWRCLFAGRWHHRPHQHLQRLCQGSEEVWRGSLWECGCNLDWNHLTSWWHSLRYQIRYQMYHIIIYMNIYYNIL